MFCVYGLMLVAISNLNASSQQYEQSLRNLNGGIIEFARDFYRVMQRIEIGKENAFSFESFVFVGFAPNQSGQRCLFTTVAC